MDLEKQKELQQKHMHLQMLDGQINQLQQHQKIIEDQIVEIMTSKQGLDDLSKQKKDSEILTPISPGIFIKASLKNNSEIIVNVGSGVAVKKSISEGEEMLDGQLNELKEAQTRIFLELTQLTNQAMGLEVAINDSFKE